MTAPRGFHRPAVQVIPIDTGRAREATDVLARVMQDDPVGGFLLPDPAERLAHGQAHYRWLIERALDEGRVDALGDPIVAVAVWLRRPALEGHLTKVPLLRTSRNRDCRWICPAQALASAVEHRRWKSR